MKTSKLFKRERIYIIPSRNGVVFFALNGIVLISAATYNNNLVYLLSFLLFAIFIVGMVQTHNNLLGLEVEVDPGIDGYAGKPLRGFARIKNKGPIVRQLLEVAPAKRAWREKNYSHCDGVDAQSEAGAEILITPKERGVYELDRVILQTRYPLGLFVAWKYCDQKVKVFVYPEPKGELPMGRAAHSGEKDTDTHHRGVSAGNEFHEHRVYMPGESYRHVDWKVFARRKVLLKKRFESDVEHLFSFNYTQLRGLSEEERLSQISEWIVRAEKARSPYELVLPQVKIPLGGGRRHLQSCQRELAKFGRAS